LKETFSKEQRRYELERLDSLPDASIDTSDIPERSLEELKAGKATYIVGLYSGA